MKTALIIISIFLGFFLISFISIFIWAHHHIKIEKMIIPKETVLYKNVKGGMMFFIIDEDEESYDVLNTMILFTHNAVIICHYIHKSDLVDILKNYPQLNEYEDIDTWGDDELMEFLPSIYVENTNIIKYEIANKVVMYSFDFVNSNIKILEEGESFYDVF